MQKKSQIHLVAKNLYYGELIELIGIKKIKALKMKYTKLTIDSPTEGEKQIAHIIEKRFNDLLVTAGE